MKLPKGTLKVIFRDPAATEENEKRNRAGGKRFKPVFHVMVKGPGNKTSYFAAFTVSGRLTMGSSVGAFPHAKSVPQLRDLRDWVETTDELEIEVDAPAPNYPQRETKAAPSTEETESNG